MPAAGSTKLDREGVSQGRLTLEVKRRLVRMEEPCQEEYWQVAEGIGSIMVKEFSRQFTIGSKEEDDAKGMQPWKPRGSGRDAIVVVPNWKVPLGCG